MTQICGVVKISLSGGQTLFLNDLKRTFDRTEHFFITTRLPNTPTPTYQWWVHITDIWKQESCEQNHVIWLFSVFSEKMFSNVHKLKNNIWSKLHHHTVFNLTTCLLLFWDVRNVFYWDVIEWNLLLFQDYSVISTKIMTRCFYNYFHDRRKQLVVL